MFGRRISHTPEAVSTPIPRARTSSMWITGTKVLRRRAEVDFVAFDEGGELIVSERDRDQTCSHHDQNTPISNRGRLLADRPEDGSSA